MSIVIEVENLSKAYRLGEFNTGALAHDLKRWWALRRGKEDPFLKIGEVNDRTSKSASNIVWSLRDINFQIEGGNAIGIVGRNGAGKSTLLKLLSQVTSPTRGEIRVRGRIASLLEVGTGFHPELTGRENIFLNGAILGMRKAEIKRKFDEIVDFAGVERYIDTPVKRYSSGMYVRLAFAVAAHLESEILIVDEVLAVGDAEFQKKCLGKMGEVSKGEGRTVLFVSHNMAAISNLCPSAFLLSNGSLVKVGATSEVISEYLKVDNSALSTRIEFSTKRSGTQNVIFSDFFITDTTGAKLTTVITGTDVLFNFLLKVNKVNIRNINVGFSIHDQYGDMLTVLYSSYQDYYFTPRSELVNAKFRFNDLNLAPGRYSIKGRIEADGFEADWPVDELGIMDVEMGDFFKTGNSGYYQSSIKFLLKGEWDS